jgi:hypothetical protein
MTVRALLPVVIPINKCVIETRILCAYLEDIDKEDNSDLFAEGKEDDGACFALTDRCY